MIPKSVALVLLVGGLSVLGSSALRYIRYVRSSDAPVSLWRRVFPNRWHTLYPAFVIAASSIWFFVGQPLFPPDEDAWTPEERHLGLHCLTERVKAYDGTRLRVAPGSLAVAKHYALAKEEFAIYGYQMCQANKSRWHPTYIWFRDLNEQGGPTYKVAIMRVENNGCGARGEPVDLIQVQPSDLPPEPDWIQWIEGCTPSGYAGPNPTR